jgi:hypothetical protein
MIAMYIDNQQVDLRTGTEVAVTKQVATVFNLEQRQTDFTNRFTIPSTMRNVAIMEQLRLPGNTSTRPYKLADARLEVNGIPYAANMKAICTKSDGIGYEVNLVGVAFDFKKEMEAAKLWQVNLPSYEHLLDASEYVDVQDVTAGYTYPTTSITQNTGSRNIVFFDRAYPAIYSKDLFQLLLLSYFTGIEGNVFTDERYLKDLTFACNVQGQAWKDYEWVELTRPSFVVASGSSVGSYFRWSDFEILRNDKGLANTVFILSPPLTRISFPTNRKVKLIISGSITATNASARISVRTKPTSQGDPLSSDQILAQSDTVVGIGPSTGTLVIDGELTVEVAREQDIYISYDYDINGFLSFGNQVTYSELSVNIEPIENRLADDTFNPVRYLPDITQWQYFGDMVRRFGLVFYRLPTGIIKMESFADITGGLLGIEDWTSKVIRLGEQTYTYGNYGKQTFFQYAGDRGAKETNEFNGWAELLFDNDNYPDTATALTTLAQGIAAPSGLMAFGGFKKEAPLNYVYVEGVNSLIFAENLINKSIGRNIPVWSDQAGGPTAFNLNNTSGQSIARISSFENLLPEFYGNILPSIARPEVLTADILLTEADFYALDFFKLKYFEQLQANYYLVKAENYIPGKPCKCTFLKVKYPE